MGRLVEQFHSIEEAREHRKKEGGRIYQTFWNTIWWYRSGTGCYTHEEALKTFKGKATLIE
jgi:hypothetical protein